jgi:hypothetical protein
VEKRNADRILVGKPGRWKPLGRPDIGGLIVLSQPARILEAEDGVIWTAFIWLRIGDQ